MFLTLSGNSRGQCRAVTLTSDAPILLTIEDGPHPGRYALAVLRGRRPLDARLRPGPGDRSALAPQRRAHRSPGAGPGMALRTHAHAPGPLAGLRLDEAQTDAGSRPFSSARFYLGPTAPLPVLSNLASSAAGRSDHAGGSPGGQQGERRPPTRTGSPWTPLSNRLWPAVGTVRP